MFVYQKGKYIIVYNIITINHYKPLCMVYDGLWGIKLLGYMMIYGGYIMKVME